MNDNEKLIKEAAEAMRRAHAENGFVTLFTDWARVALAVFEKAYTPTEDERRVPSFADREKRASSAWEFFARTDREMTHDFRGGYHQGVIDEAGRRSEVPEPSAEDGCRMCANSEGQEHSRACHFDEHTRCEGISEGRDSVPCGCACHEPNLSARMAQELRKGNGHV